MDDHACCLCLHLARVASVQSVPGGIGARHACWEVISYLFNLNIHWLATTRASRVTTLAKSYFMNLFVQYYSFIFDQSNCAYKIIKNEKEMVRETPINFQTLHVASMSATITIQNHIMTVRSLSDAIITVGLLMKHLNELFRNWFSTHRQHHGCWSAEDLSPAPVLLCKMVAFVMSQNYLHIYYIYV